MEPERPIDPRRITVLSGVLWLVTVWLYLPTSGFDFISFDDPLFVTENPHVNRGVTWDGLRWAFTKAEIDYWRPLCWLTHMLDVEFHRMDAGGHHVTSLVLHALSAVVLFLFCATLFHNLPASFCVAALFAWHPLHVESVAWIAERKDVLCGLFWHISLLLYVRHARSRGHRWLWATLAVYFMGLMSKPMIVTLPFQLLLLDFWPLGRAGSPAEWRRRVLEKIPFFALSLIGSAFTFQAQLSVGEMRPEVVPTLALRIQNALVAYAGYLGHLVWPSGLGLFYPFPDSIPAATWAGAGALLGIITYAAFVLRGSSPGLLVGWLWFLGTLVPVVGFFKVGGQASADRYTYIATTGLFWIAGLSLFPSGLSLPRLRIRMLIAGGILIALIATCRAQISHWQNNITLFTHTVAVTRDNWVMMNNLARSHLLLDNLDAARQVYEQIIAVRPHYFAHYYLGKLQLEAGRTPQAARNFEAALRLEPGFHLAAFELGELALAGGQVDVARELFERTLRTDPQHPGARTRLIELTP